MQLLHDLRGIFGRRKPVVVDLALSQASGLKNAADTHVEAKPIPKTPPAGPSGETDERSDKRVPQRSKGGATPNIEEVMTVVRQISSHLETQTRRTDTLIECMERLPAALDALPEINRQNSTLLEIVNEYLGHARQRDDTLNKTLGGITNASERQTEVLGLLQQQMDHNNQSSHELKLGLVDFKDAISQLAGTNRRTTTVLSEMNESNESREQALTQMLSRTQKWMIASMVCCAAASLTAIAVAGFVIFGQTPLGG